MNLVFMNSLEKKRDDGQMQTAQVIIQEEEGIWQVSWIEANEQGQQVQDHWFNGSSWDEMLTIFRYRLAEKLALGYVPLMDGLFEPTEATGRAKVSQMLSYYSEQHPRQEVFEALRKWRLEQAIEEKKAAYLIFTNRILRMISSFLPYNSEELQQIPGIGEKKATLYGEAIFAVTKNVQREHQFPLDWVMEQIDQQQFEQWIYKQKEEKYRQQIDQQKLKKQMLLALEEGVSIADLATSLQMTRREAILWVEQLDEEGYDVSAWVTKQLATVPEQERQAAWQAYQQLGDRYLKPVMQTVYTEEQLKERNLDDVYEWLRMVRIQFRKHHGNKHHQAS